MEGNTSTAAAGTPATKTRIHVGGLGQSVTSDDLRKLFSAMGTVEGLEIIRSKGRSFAYVDILPSSSNSLTKLFSTYNGCVWKGGKLKLEKAKEHFLTRLKREWAESRAEAEESLHQAASSDNLNNKTKLHFSKTDHLKIFFPRLQKVKALPLSGTGKHRYSFQRVQTPVFPVHFCDCEEHSGQFNVVKRSEVEHHEEIDSVVNAEELSMMSSVMNKLFERENVSTAVLTMKRDDFIEPVQGSLSNEEDGDHDDDDDDDLIINVVSNANNPTATSGSREPQKISSEKSKLSENQKSKDEVIQRAGKVQKKNTLLLRNKRKPLLDKEHGYEVTPQLRRNSQFNESDLDFEENEADDDNLIINVSTGNEEMALSGSRKPAKASSKQKFKSSETQTSEDILTEDEHPQEKDSSPSKKKMRPFFAEEKDRNEAVFTLTAEKGKFETQSTVPFAVQTSGTGQECPVKQLNTGCSWSQKSSWRALVGDRSNSAFSLSNILQNVDTTNVKQLISDGSEVDKALDSRNEKLGTPTDLDGMSVKTKMGNMLAEAQPHQTNMEKKLISDGAKVDKTLDSKNEKLAISKDMSGKTEMGNMLAEAQPNQINMASSNSGRGSSWLHKSSWIQLVNDKSTSFSISEILPAATTIQELKHISEDGVHSTDGYSNIMEQYNNIEPEVNGSMALDVGREGDCVQSIPESSHQSVENNNNVSLPAVGNICNSEPQQGFGVGEICSFMRSSASLKEWAKTKASLKGSRKKKQVI